MEAGGRGGGQVFRAAERRTTCGYGWRLKKKGYEDDHGRSQKPGAATNCERLAQIRAPRKSQAGVEAGTNNKVSSTRLEPSNLFVGVEIQCEVGICNLQCFIQVAAGRVFVFCFPTNRSHIQNSNLVRSVSFNELTTRYTTNDSNLYNHNEQQQVFIATNVSCLVLKKDRPGHEHFTVPTVVPVLAVLASAVLLTQQTGETWLISIGYIVVGSVLFVLARFSRNRLDRGTEDASTQR